MIDYKQLQALAAIVEEDSFDKAANRLHISQSAISQRLKQLEDSVGQTLVLRCNPIQATNAGQQLIKHYRQISLLQSELYEALSQKQTDGYTRIAIGLNADSLATWFLDAVQPLLNEDKVLLELKVDDQDQTHHLLKTGQVIGCISSNPKPMQGCICVPLGIMTYRCLASPGYVERYFPDGVNRKNFIKAPIAEFSNKDELQNRYLKKFFQVKANEYPKHRIPSTESFFQMIIRGLACGMIPDQQSRELLKKDIVIDLSPGQFLDIPLYWHVWNLKSDLYRKLTQALTRVASKELTQISP